MPYRVAKQDCEQSDGTGGRWVVQKKESGSWVQASCHKTKSDAEDSVAARRANKGE